MPGDAPVYLNVARAVDAGITPREGARLAGRHLAEALANEGLSVFSPLRLPAERRSRGRGLRKDAALARRGPSS